ncbi:DUF4263 domain-containing protein [Candidatus Woesebacteria bacterium]|nr:DUF4263 domain-containing protein [Candidatus Woesebacteria bacterium]
MKHNKSSSKKGKAKAKGRRSLKNIPTSGDFEMNYYEELDSHKIYTSEKRIAKIFGARDKKTGESFLRIISRSKKPHGWSINWGVNLYNSLHINKLFQGIIKIVKKLKWSGVEVNDIEHLKQQLREREEAIVALEQTNEKTRKEHDELMIRFGEQQKKILQSRIKEFKEDIKKLKDLITSAKSGKIPESELQEFLYQKPWFFGTEYVNSVPQKLRGAHSKFDFYIERFNKTNDIVEIKLLSDQIINKDNSINTKVVQAVDQLIDYMESSVAAAHSRVISKEEGIYELRPRGIVIIGSDNSKNAKEKLQKWNYQFAHITILTYLDILKKAEALLKNIEKKSK